MLMGNNLATTKCIGDALFQAVAELLVSVHCTYLQVFKIFLDDRLVDTDFGYYRVLECKLLFHLIHLVSLEFQLTVQFFNVILTVA